MTYMFLENISEISFLSSSGPLLLKVGTKVGDEQIKELVPIFNPDGALIAVRVIGSIGQELSILTTYGVVCSIKTA